MQASSFYFTPYTIRAFLPRSKQKVVFEATYPRFRDKLTLNTYRTVYLERIAKQKKPTTYDRAVLELLDQLEDYLFEDLDL